jgi:mannose-6-phosphate isomerase-like protein (cupin superfamily)
VRSAITLVLVLGAVLLPGRLPAQDPPGFNLWTPEQLQSNSTPRVQYKNHSVIPMFRREASGNVEMHAHEDDMFVVQSGEATLIVGGELVGAQETKRPNEWTGSSIRNGTTQQLRAGVIVHIPAKMPHQMLLDPGKQITYFVLKIAAAP